MSGLLEARELRKSYSRATGLLSGNGRRSRRKASGPKGGPFEAPLEARGKQGEPFEASQGKPELQGNDAQSPEGGSGRNARLGMEPEKEPLIKKANRS